MADQNLLAAVDIGGSNVRCAISSIDSPLSILARSSVLTPEATEPVLFVDFLHTQITNCLQECGRDLRSLKALGCTAPGITDAPKGVVISAANLEGWENVPLGELLREKFGVPAAVENDVNAAAIGEQKFGAGRGHHSLIYMTISTGVAAGIIIDDKLLRGKRHCAGEIGFMLGEPAHIGRDWGINGCLELTAAGIGIAQQWETTHGQTNVSAKEVFRAAHAGDEEAIKIINRAGDYLSQAAVSLCTVIDPDILVLGGSIVKNEAAIFERIESVVTSTLPFPPRVVPAALGGDSPLIGALALAQALS